MVPKAHSLDQWRVIVDLSLPIDCSVSDGISPNLCSVVCSSVDDAVEEILRQGVGCQLIKIDLKNAYRIVPVHPDDQPLLGVSWNGSVYFDRALPFGLWSASKIFMAVSHAMSWVLYNRGIRNLIHYLDDFLIFSSQDQDQAWTLRQLALDTFEELNILVSMSKLEGPATVVTFLGI